MKRETSLTEGAPQAVGPGLPAPLHGLEFQFGINAKKLILIYWNERR